MTAIVSRERARATSLTGAAGLMLIMAAFVMMIVAAPAQAHHRPPGPARLPAARLTTDVCHQLTSRNDSMTVRMCLAGPSVRAAVS